MDPLISALVCSIGVLDLIDVLGYFAAHVRGDQLLPPPGLELIEISGENSTKLATVTDDDLGEDQVTTPPPIDKNESNERLVVDPIKTDDDSKTTTITPQVEVDKISSGDDQQSKQKVDPGDSSQSAVLIGADGLKTENQTQVFIETEREANERDTQPLLDETKLRPISRDDELRHHRVKRSSVSSVSSHGSRKEELELLSALEAEEQGDDNFDPIVYSGADYPLDFPDDVDYLETIPEAGSSSNESTDFTERNTRETSPKPNVPVDVSLPWGDLKAVPHARDNWAKNKSLSIDEVVEEEKVDLSGLSSDKIVEEEDKAVIVLKKINLIGIEPKTNVDENNNEEATTIEQTNRPEQDKNVSSLSRDLGAASTSFIHHESLIQPTGSGDRKSPYPLSRSRTPSEDYGDQGDISEILNMHEEKVVLADDLLNTTDDADADIIEYYWKPGTNTVEQTRRFTDSDTTQEQLSSVGKKLVSWESGEDVGKIEGPCTGRSKKSHSIAYDSLKYDHVAARRLSLAETFIIPKHLNISDDRVSDIIVALENEAEEYKYIWGIDVHAVPLAENDRIATRKSSRSQSISLDHGLDSENTNKTFSNFSKISFDSKDDNVGRTPTNSTVSLVQDDDFDLPAVPPVKTRIRSQSIAYDSARFGRRRTSMADSFIIPRSVRESGGVDFQTLAQMESEAEAYRNMWGLDIPEDVEPITNDQSPSPSPPPLPPPPRTTRSQSISMGILARRGLRRNNRRSSMADIVLVPRTLTKELSDDELAMLENEAYAYQQAFGLSNEDLTDINSTESSVDPVKESLQPEPGNTDTGKRDALTPIRELSEARSRSISPQSANISTPNLPDIETSFSDEDEELVRISQIRPTTPADYDDYMRKFPEQLCPDINIQSTSRASPTLETYLHEMERNPRPKSPIEVKPSPPATLEVYLERMRSQTPEPIPIITHSPESSPEPATTTQADYDEYMEKISDQVCPSINIVEPVDTKAAAQPRASPTLEMYLQDMEKVSSPVRSPPIVQSPPATLEVYLERMRSKSPSPNT